MPKQTQIIFGALVLIAVIAAGSYMLLKRPAAAPPTSTTNSTSTPISITGIEGLPEGATVTVTDRVNADLFTKTPRPSLTRTLPRGTLPEDAYAALVKGRASLVQSLTDAPAAMSNWISLGTTHKQVGDFEGARIYWAYVATVNPENLVVHWNLGTLYENYLHDVSKAESEFRKAIAIDPTYVGAYIELSNLLASQNKNTEALTVLSDGIAKNAGAIDLLIARAHIYRTMGDKAAARSAYDAAIAQANKNKNGQLANDLTAEKNAL